MAHHDYRPIRDGLDVFWTLSKFLIFLFFLPSANSMYWFGIAIAECAAAMLSDSLLLTLAS